MNCRGAEAIRKWESRDGRLIHCTAVSRAPDFAGELAYSGFRDNLFAVTGVRRLLRVVNVERTSESVAILDRRNKTVVRVVIERGNALAGGR